MKRMVDNDKGNLGFNNGVIAICPITRYSQLISLWKPIRVFLIDMLDY